MAVSACQERQTLKQSASVDTADAEGDAPKQPGGLPGKVRVT